jgi:transcriptional regulator with XRE-family HTH domain
MDIYCRMISNTARGKPQNWVCGSAKFRPMRTPASVPDSTLEVFGTVLKDCRTAAGLSQEELAFAAALDRVFISSLESGRKEPGLGTLLKLARGLEIRPSDMLHRTEKLLFPAPLKGRMARKSGVKVPVRTEICQGCKAQYAVYARPLKERERGRFRCRYCKTPLGSWLGTIALIYETRSLPKLRRRK